MTTKEIKLMIIQNFIDHYTTDSVEREQMRLEAEVYVDEDWVDEIKQSQSKNDYKVVSASSPSGLTRTVMEFIKDGWKPIGGHQIVEVHRQNRFSGTEHRDTVIESEYTQTMIKE